MSLKEYIYFCCSFKGRLSRKGFLFFTLANISFTSFYGSIFLATLAFSVKNINVILYAILLIFLIAISFVVIFIDIIGGITSVVKRLHDLNLSGWWLLSSFCTCYTSFFHDCYVLYKRRKRRE